MNSARRWVMLACIAASGCGQAPRPPYEPGVSSRLSMQLTESDKDILQLVQTSLINDPEFRPNRPQAVRYDSIIVCEQSQDCPTREQVLSSVFKMRPRIRDSGLRDSLNRRNVQPVSLAPVAAGGVNILMGCEADNASPLKPWPIPPERFPGRTPNGIVSATLPGYSNDGNQAIVLISFSWSMHGGAGAFLLSHSAEGWKLEWRDYEYYL